MQLQNNFDPIVCMGSQREGRYTNFVQIFTIFQSDTAGFMLNFLCLKCDDLTIFFFDLIGTHVFLFLSSLLHNSQAINYFLQNKQFFLSYCNYHNIPQVEVFFRVSFCSLINYKLYGNYSMYNHPICKRDITQQDIYSHSEHSQNTFG